MGEQLHKRIPDEMVRSVFLQYEQSDLVVSEALHRLGISRRRFFDLLARYRSDPETFSIIYRRAGRKNISEAAEAAIKQELLREKELIENKDIPIRHYNYSAIRDALADQEIVASVPTIISRAKELGCWHGRPPKSKHTREVLTDQIGELAQHDSSHHQWSPFVAEKAYAITTLDDCSRLLLYADLVEKENSWVHIQALRSVIEQYGCPLRYYTDQHSIFRFVQGRDSWYRTHTALTDDKDPQFKQVTTDCNISLVYALSPQAKGKIERPYQWMQDRVVRRCARDHVIKFSEIQQIFRSEVHRYNTRQVHSTTGEVPIIRFERLKREQKNSFQPFHVPPPYQSSEDIFAFRAERRVTGYQTVSLHNTSLKVPHIQPHQRVQLRLVPNLIRHHTIVRIWHQNKLVAEYVIPFKDIPFEKFTT